MFYYASSFYIFQYTLHYIFNFLIFQYINNDLLQKIAQYDPTAAEDHQLIPPEKIEVYLKGKTINIIGLALGLWCLCHFQQYFSYIVVVSFIDEGNRRSNRPVASH